MIVIESVMEPLTKGFPSCRRQLRGDRLVPNGSRTFDIMFHETDPDRLINLVLMKIFFTTRTPTPGIVTIKLRKRKLRKAS